MNAPIHVAVTGAAGNIGYSLLWRVASGDCFGPDQPIVLHLLEITPALDRLQGVVMELKDSAMDLVVGIEATDSAEEAFANADAVFLVGSRPRTKDMDRSDLVAANGPIFVSQGAALQKAKPTVRVVTVGNPCNTNCLIARANAPALGDRCFSAMTRLDQNRATGQIAEQLGTAPHNVRDVFIWGNHADLMVPDLRLASASGASVLAKVDADWVAGAFNKTVTTRGKAIIEARGASSAASAASAAVDHMRDWWHGTGDRVVSMAIVSQGWYGVPEGMVFSFPVRVSASGDVHVLTDLELDAETQARLQANVDQLAGERAAVADLL